MLLFHMRKKSSKSRIQPSLCFALPFRPDCFDSRHEWWICKAFDVPEISDLFDVVFRNICSSASNITVVHIFLSFNKSYLLMNVENRHIFCSLEFYHCILFHPHRYTRLIFCHYNSKPSSRSILKFGLLVREGLTDRRQFSFVPTCVFPKKETMFYFTAPFSKHKGHIFSSRNV